MHEQRRELSIEHQAAIYLVRDDEHVVLARHGADVLQVLGAEVAAAGVGGVADDNCTGAGVDQLVHRLQVAGPVLLGQQRVVSHGAVQGLGDDLVEGEPGLGDQDVVA